MFHQFTSEDDDYSACIICGAVYRDGDDYGRCSGRTHLVHGDPHEVGHDLDCGPCYTGTPCLDVSTECDCRLCD